MTAGIGACPLIACMDLMPSGPVSLAKARITKLEKA